MVVGFDLLGAGRRQGACATGAPSQVHRGRCRSMRNRRPNRIHARCRAAVEQQPPAPAARPLDERPRLP
jgi:hypothetical protein